MPFRMTKIGLTDTSCEHSLKTNLLVSSSAENDLGDFDIRHESAAHLAPMRAKSIPGFGNSSTVSGLREAIVLLHA